MGYKKLESGTVAGNVNADFVVPANAAYRISYAELILTTSGTVANRRALLRILDDAGAEVTDFHTGMTVPASQSAQHHQFMQGTYRETSFIGGSIQVPFGGDLVALPGWTVRYLIEAGVASDSYTVKMVVDQL